MRWVAHVGSNWTFWDCMVWCFFPMPIPMLWCCCHLRLHCYVSGFPSESRNAHEAPVTSTLAYPCQKKNMSQDMIAGNCYYDWDIETGVFSLGIQRLALSHSLLPRQKLTCPLKRGQFQKVPSFVFQPLIFRGELLIFRGVKPESKAPILVKILARCRNTKPAKSSACWCSAIYIGYPTSNCKAKRTQAPLMAA